MEEIKKVDDPNSSETNNWYKFLFVFTLVFFVFILVLSYFQGRDYYMNYIDNTGDASIENY
jgi:preprotein translocase subunit SecG